MHSSILQTKHREENSMNLTNQALPLAETPTGIEVTVPRLDVHAMVVFREGGGPSPPSRDP